MQNINQKICHLIIGSMLSLGFLFLFLTSPTSATNPASTAVNLDLINGIAIRILDSAGTSEINDLVFNLDASSTGSFSSSDFNVEVDTSNRTGYKLYMTSNYTLENGVNDGSGTNGDSGIVNPSATYTNALVNLDNPDYTIPTLSSTVTKTDFSSGGEYKNHWGYSLDDTTYSPVPVHSTEQCIAGCNGEKDEPVAHDKTPVYVGMNVSLASASGTYRNNLLFSAIANPVPTAYTLSFNLNGGSAPTSDPDVFNDMTASEVAAQHTFTIPSIKPVRSGYMLSYWQDSQGNHYAPGDTITIIGNEEYIGTETLTAVWVVGCADGPNRICFVANEPSGTVEGEMEDQTIVYMTSTTANEAVDETPLSSSTTELTLYSPNWLLSGYGFKGWNTAADGSGTMYGPNQTIALTSAQQAALSSTGLTLYAQWVASAGDMASWAGCSSLNQGDVTALTYDSDTYAVAKLADNKCWMIENMRNTSFGPSTTDWKSGQAAYYTLQQYNYVNLTGSVASPIINGSVYQWLSYGGVYSWASAINTTTASSEGFYNYDTTTSAFTPTGVTQGICPTGWRIPKLFNGSSTLNDSTSDFRYLNYKLNGSYNGGGTHLESNNLRSYPNNFIYSGGWLRSATEYRGVRGTYYTSTVRNESYAGVYYVYNQKTVVSFNNKIVGRSVRCVIGD